MHMSVAQAYAILEHSSVVELPAYIRRVPGSIPGVPILGKRQRLAVLRLTVNQFPSGKHWRFNSSLPHSKIYGICKGGRMCS